MDNFWAQSLAAPLLREIISAEFPRAPGTLTISWNNLHFPALEKQAIAKRLRKNYKVIGLN